MSERLLAFQKEIEKGLLSADLPESPQNLYEPIRYFLKLGGKRIRPALTLFGAALFNEKPLMALDQALAIEVFHNFTLVHDDIMDRADLRRGQETVHQRWNDSIAILSGDGMMVKAYQLLANAPSEQLPRLLDVFSSTALEVCEGQQLDMDFASLDHVSESEYIHMIKLKTAVLLSASLRIGAIRAGAEGEVLDHLSAFAINTGLAFQIKDDYLDSFGDQDSVGKEIGGDIREGKRTWLTVKAFEMANEAQRSELKRAFDLSDTDERVKAVLGIYDQLDLAAKSDQVIQSYSNKALEELDKVDGNESVKKDLKDLVGLLMNRSK